LIKSAQPSHRHRHGSAAGITPDYPSAAGDVSRAFVAFVTYPVRAWLASLTPAVEHRCKAEIHYF